MWKLFSTSLPLNQFMTSADLGLSSYYRKFIRNFAKIAHPLHQLTRKNAPFTWSPDCQTAFEVLKRKLVTSPVLAYPNFKRDFVLETDASIHGIGAVLGQHQDDGNVHSISYASRALSVAEKHYGITTHVQVCHHNPLSYIGLSPVSHCIPWDCTLQSYIPIQLLYTTSHVFAIIRGILGISHGFPHVHIPYTCTCKCVCVFSQLRGQ